MPRTSHWTDYPLDDQDRLSFLMAETPPIVPAGWREGILGERWVEGRPCVVQPCMSLTALIVGVSFEGLQCSYDAKYLYEDETAALLALRDWNGFADPPGPWILELKTSRAGPGTSDRACLQC